MLWGKKKTQNIISEGKKNFLGKKAYIKMINLKKKLKKGSWIKMWYICRIEYYSFTKKKKCHLQQYGWIGRLPY